MMADSSVGSLSSRYIATCESVTRRRSGHTSPYASSPMKTVTEMMRNAMMAAALNRKDSRPDAESSRARAVPATTTTAPRIASLRRQRLRTLRMTSTSRVRWSISSSNLDPGGFAPADPPRLRSRGPLSPAPLRRARLWRALRSGLLAPRADPTPSLAGEPLRSRRARLLARLAIRGQSPRLTPTGRHSRRLEKFLLSREAVGDNGFGRQHQQSDHQQIPPRALAPFGVFARHFLRRQRFCLSRGGASGPRCHKLTRIQRRQIGL